MRGPAIALLLALVAAFLLLFQKPDTQAQLDSDGSASLAADSNLLSRVEALEMSLNSQRQGVELRELQRRVAALEQKLNDGRAVGRSSSTSGQLDTARRSRETSEIQRSLGSLESKLSTVQRDISPLKQSMSRLSQSVLQLERTVARIDYGR